MAEFKGVADQVVEHLQQQIPVPDHLRQVGSGVELQLDALVVGIEPVGAQGLLHRRTDVHRFELDGPARFQTGEVEHIVDEAGEAIGLGIGNTEEFLFLLLSQLIAEVMQGLHIALDVEQRCPQFVGDVADETTLSSVQLHFAGQILNGDGDALEAFTAGIAHGLHHDAQGAGRLPDAAAQIFAVDVAGEQCIEG